MGSPLAMEFYGFLKMNDNDKNSLPRLYLVTLIDVLGQKRLLEEHRPLTETTEGHVSLKNESGQEKFRKIQNETYGKVFELRQNFETASRGYGEAILNQPTHNTVPPEDQHIIKDLAKPVSYQFFSDTIIIYTPLISKDELKMRYRIATTISACANIMLVGFARGTFFRGGMDIGVGTEFPDGKGIYGLVLNDVYRLESKIAGYPRIVVGKKLKDLIKCRERITVYSKFFNDMNDRLDNSCNSLISEDRDGNYIVDFLGKNIANLSRKSFPDQSKDYIGRGLMHISEQYNKHLKEGNEKLSSRYELLKDYYFERLDNWGLQATEVEAMNEGREK